MALCRRRGLVQCRGSALVGATGGGDAAVGEAAGVGLGSSAGVLLGDGDGVGVSDGVGLGVSLGAGVGMGVSAGEGVGVSGGEGVGVSGDDGAGGGDCGAGIGAVVEADTTFPVTLTSTETVYVSDVPAIPTISEPEYRPGAMVEGIESLIVTPCVQCGPSVPALLPCRMTEWMRAAVAPEVAKVSFSGVPASELARNTST